VQYSELTFPVEYACTWIGDCGNGLPSYSASIVYRPQSSGVYLILYKLSFFSMSTCLGKPSGPCSREYGVIIIFLQHLIRKSENIVFPNISYHNSQVQFSGTSVSSVHDEIRGNRSLDASRVRYAGAFDLDFIQFELRPNSELKRTK